jgi:hypothetical protein
MENFPDDNLATSPIVGMAYALPDKVILPSKNNFMQQNDPFKPKDVVTPR